MNQRTLSSLARSTSSRFLQGSCFQCRRKASLIRHVQAIFRFGRVKRRKAQRRRLSRYLPRCSIAAMKSDKAMQSFIFTELMDCIDDLVVVLDAKLRIIEANRNAMVVFGYPAAELVSKSLPSFIEERERRKIAMIFKGARERRGGQTVLLARSSRKLPLRFSFSPVPGAGGKPRGYLFVGHCEKGDILAPDYDPSNGLAARMLEGFADPVFIIDGPSRTVRDCNEAALDSFGFSREELKGRRLLNHSASDDENRRNRAMEARADKTYATMGIFQERILFPRKGASSLPCDLTGLPFFRPDGSLALIIAMLFDRSAEEEREAELSNLIRQVNDLAAELAGAASSYSTRSKTKSLSELGFTPRQVEIVRLCASGDSSKEIGFRLGIAESTVKNHLAVMYRKLGVNSRMEFIHSISIKRIKID
jgi:PAS domain S-box-containing protein